jgi:hypothetical protein
MKMPFALWSSAAVGQLVQAQFGVKLPVRTVGHYLKRWGFTPQKPMKKAYEQRPEAVRQWPDQEFPDIAACAEKEGAEIHWGDETGLRSDDVQGPRLCAQGPAPGDSHHHIHHDRQADNLRRSLEVAEGIAHLPTIRATYSQLNAV